MIKRSVVLADDMFKLFPTMIWNMKVITHLPINMRKRPCRKTANDFKGYKIIMGHRVGGKVCEITPRRGPFHVGLSLFQNEFANRPVVTVINGPRILFSNDDVGADSPVDKVVTISFNEGTNRRQRPKRMLQNSQSNIKMRSWAPGVRNNGIQKQTENYNCKIDKKHFIRY